MRVQNSVIGDVRDRGERAVLVVVFELEAIGQIAARIGHRVEEAGSRVVDLLPPYGNSRGAEFFSAGK